MNEAVLILDIPEFKPLPPREAFPFVVGNSSLTISNDIGDAKKQVGQLSRLRFFITNAPDFDLLQDVRQRHPSSTVILVTDLPMKDYSERLQDQEHMLVDHVIANRQREGSTVEELRVTLAKIQRQDLFGIDKYLTSGTVIHRSPITGSKDRDLLNQKVQQFVERCHLGQHMGKVAYGITEELLMNTIYDAPLAAGIQEYENFPRNQVLELKPEEYGELSFGCDGRTLAIGTSDPFGALSRHTLMHYTRKILMRRDSNTLIDTKKGGAGLGFFKILFSSHALVCNVSPKTRTEIIALIDVSEPLRDFSKMARSIHYFAKS